MKASFFIFLIGFSILTFGQEKTENYQIPLTEYEYNAIYSSEVKLGKGGKKLMRIYLYKTDIDGKRYDEKVVIGKIELFNNKKGKGSPDITHFDGTIVKNKHKNYTEIRIGYTKNIGIDFMKFKPISKILLIESEDNKLKFKPFHWAQIGALGEFNKAKFDSSYDEMIENYYIQKIKDCIKNEKFWISEIGKITSPITNAKEIITSSSLDLNYDGISASNNENNSSRNSDYYEDLIKENHKKIKKGLRESYILNYLPNLTKMSFYNNGEKNFEASVNKDITNGFFSFPSKEYSDKMQTKISTLRAEETKSRLEKLKEEQARIKKEKEEYQTWFENMKNSIPLEERISFKDYMNDATMSDFFQYIYYGMFDKAKEEYFKPHSQYFAVIYVNLHVSLNDKHATYYNNKRSNYKYVTVGNQSQTRNIAVDEKYIESVKNLATNTIIEYNNLFEETSLRINMSKINSDIENFTSKFSPNSPIVLRLLNNLFEYSKL